jgi:hypothetical protein
MGRWTGFAMPGKMRRAAQICAHSILTPKIVQLSGEE